MPSFSRLVTNVLEADQEIWTALNWMDRGDLEKLLIDAGIQPHPQESDDDLKQAIVSNIEDGTIDIHSIMGEDGTMLEKSPKGWEGTVKAMKDEDEIDNPWALAHWMKNKGYQSHKKEQEGGDDPYADYEHQQRPDYDPGGEIDHAWDTNRPGEEMEEDNGRNIGHGMGTGTPYVGDTAAYSKGAREGVGGDVGGARLHYGECDFCGQSYSADQEFCTNPDCPFLGEPEEKQREYNTLRDIPDGHDARHYTEGVRVVHPTKGGNQPGTVTKISEAGVTVDWDNLQERLSSPSVLPFKDAKYLNIIDEYSEASTESKEQMPKKQVDETLIAVAMAPIGGTMIRTHRPSDDFDISLTYEDIGLVIEDDEEEEDSDSGKPWENGEKKKQDSSNRSELRTSSNGGADYTNVPQPSDSILTNQESQPKVTTDPLATMDGAESAGDGDEPDGDYGSDLVPVDAPDTPDYKDGDYGNARKAGSGEVDTNEINASDSGDYEGSKPEDKNKKVEEGNMNLTYADLGLKILNEAEMGQGYAEGYANETHDAAGGEIAMSRELLDKLLMAVSKQSPEQDELDAICQGLENASSQKGQTLDVEDVDMIKQEMSSAYSGGGEEPAAPEGGDDYAAPDAEPDPAPEGGEYDDTEQDAEEDRGSNQAGDARHMNQGSKGDHARDDQHGYKSNDNEDGPYLHEGEGDYYDYEEDRARGDGKVAGPEGGDEHEGKRQLMDKKGIDRDDDGDVDSDDWKIGRDKAIKRSKAKEDKGSGTPIGTGSNSGPGGGSTQDLSKPKNQRPSKPLGSDKGGGPGGSSADEFGQKPTDDGGSNLLPANPDGSSRATPQGPWSEKELNPRSSKALAAESAKKQIDEAIMLGMAAIPGTMRGTEPEIQIEDDDPDAEIKMMRRRAGIAQWWKIG